MLKIHTKNDAIFFACVLTVISVAASLAITWLASGGVLAPVAAIPATLVPLLVCPVVSLWVAHKTLKIQELNDRLKHALERDHLTDLLNRRSFYDRVTHEDFDYGSILMFDIDHFKRVNDTYGHAVGDEAIRLVASQMEKSMAGNGFSARWGGEEFAAFLPNVSPNEAERLADTLRQTIAAQKISAPSADFNCTISGGIAVLPSDRDIEIALQKADEALYASKKKGRNQITLAPNELH